MLLLQKSGSARKKRSPTGGGRAHLIPGKPVWIRGVGGAPDPDLNDPPAVQQPLLHAAPERGAVVDPLPQRLVTRVGVGVHVDQSHRAVPAGGRARLVGAWRKPRHTGGFTQPFNLVPAGATSSVPPSPCTLPSQTGGLHHRLGRRDQREPRLERQTCVFQEGSAINCGLINIFSRGLCNSSHILGLGGRVCRPKIRAFRGRGSVCLFEFSPLPLCLHRDPCYHPLFSGILAIFRSIRQTRIPKLTSAPESTLDSLLCQGLQDGVGYRVVSACRIQKQHVNNSPFLSWGRNLWNCPPLDGSDECSCLAYPA